MKSGPAIARQTGQVPMALYFIYNKMEHSSKHSPRYNKIDTL